MYSLWLLIGVVPLVASTLQPFEPRRRWFKELFSEAEQEFGMQSALNSKCRSDFQLYMVHLRNQSVWAVRMRESSEWPSVGLYSGMVDHLGNYAECLRLSGPNSISGQFCMARMRIKSFPVSNLDPSAYLTTDGCECEQCSAWSMLQKCTGDPVRAERRIIQWAVCIPSSCSAEDLQASLNSLVVPIFRSSGMKVDITTDASMCTSADTVPEYSEGYYLSRSIFLSLIVLAVAATVHDLFVQKNEDFIGSFYWLIETDGYFRTILNCFSLRQSYQTLMETSEESKNPVYSLKFIMMLFVIMGHRWLFSLTFPLFQTEELEMDYHSGGMFLLSQLNAVDVFLLVSGFLLYRLSVEPMRRLGFPYVGIYLAFRIMKTVPAQGLMILFFTNILPHLGDGPLWKSTMTWMSETCKSSWMDNLLAINNMDTADKLCLVPTWYLAVDFQNSLVGVCILFILVKNKKLGILLIGFIFLISALTTSLAAYSTGLSGFFVMGIARTRYPMLNPEFNHLYFSSYPRLSAFLMGMVLGMVIEQFKKKNYKISPALSLTLLLFSLATAILVQYHGFILIYDTQYSDIWKAVFAGFYRPFYILPYATLIGIYFISGIGILDLLFTRRIFFAMGKMGISMLLCSFVFQMYHMCSQRSPMPTSTKLNIYMWSIADIFISLILAFLFYLFVDAPFTSLFKLIRGYITRKLFYKPADKIK